MVRTLRTHIREKNLDQDSVGVPLTFIVYPQRDKSDKSEHDGASIEENQAEKSGSSLQQALQQRRKKIAENADERADLLAAHLAAGASGGRPIWIAKSSAGGKGQGICISRSCEEVLIYDYVCMCVCVCIHNMYVCIYVCMCLYMYVCMYI
jgi:hypothetical protein